LTYIAQWTANNYVITFNPNLPSDAQPSDVSKYDIEQIDISYDGTIPSLPELEDYETRDDSSIRYVKFLGWFNSATSGIEITEGSKYTATGGSTYYAHWEIISRSYQIKYNGNGATNGVSMSNSMNKYGVSKSLSKNKYVRRHTIRYNDAKNDPEETEETINFPFLGWATSASGDVVYVDEEPIALSKSSVPSGTLNLYAKWKQVQAILNSPGHEGYVLDGWYSKATGGTKIGDAGEIKTFTQDTILYATWTPQKRTVSFNQNGGVSEASTI